MIDKGQKLIELLKLLQNDTVKPSDIEQFLTLIITAVKNTVDNFKTLSAENIQEIKNTLAYISVEHTKVLSEVDGKNSQLSDEVKNKIQEVQNLFNQFMALKPKDGEPGKNANPKDVVPLVLEKIKLPEPVVLDDAQKIVEKLEGLTGDNRLDASAIKNLPENTGGQKFVGGGGRNITIRDEGAIISKALRDIDFVGAGVAVSLINGRVTVTVSGGAAASESNGETLTPVGDGLNFTFAHAPKAGGIRNVWKAETGQLLTPTTDYTISGSTLTATSDQTGFTLIANYTY